MLRRSAYPAASPMDGNDPRTTFDERLQLIRRRSMNRSEIIRLRVERIVALQASLWERMDRLEQEWRTPRPAAPHDLPVEESGAADGPAVLAVVPPHAS